MSFGWSEGLNGMETPRRPPRAPPAEVTLLGTITEEDVQPLCSRVRRALDERPAILICDVGAIDLPDVVIVGALARMQLTAMRMGGRILLRDASPDLTDLLDLCGLSAVVPLEPC